MTENISHEQHESPEKILFKEESFLIQGAIFEVYKELGPGFLEAVYQEALEHELHTRTIPFVAQPELTINYKGVKLSQSYRPDLICHEKTIIEIKAVNDLRPEHQAQTLNYLKATGIRLALLVNFGCHSKVTIRRLVL
jgi:GxxExxY protein